MMNSFDNFGFMVSTVKVAKLETRGKLNKKLKTLLRS